jgi:hypothetical protein
VRQCCIRCYVVSGLLSCFLRVCFGGPVGKCPFYGSGGEWRTIYVVSGGRNWKG